MTLIEVHKLVFPKSKETAPTSVVVISTDSMLQKTRLDIHGYS